MPIKLLLELLVCLVNLAWARDLCFSSAKILASWSILSGVDPARLTTRDVIRFNLTWSSMGTWGEKSSILMINKERDDIVYMYRPIELYAIHENKRVVTTHTRDSNTILLDISFFKNEDDESRWGINYQSTENEIITLTLCDIFIRADQTPFVILEHEVVGKGRVIINKYNENDKVKVTCTLNKGDPKKALPEFDIVFPTNSKIEDVTDNRDLYVKIKIVTLTADIHKKYIYCYVTGGDSANDTSILQFNLNTPKVQRRAETTVAISLAVFICIILLGMTFIGAYLLIVKQRKDTTKKLVEHHTKMSQLRPTGMTGMSRVTRMTRMTRTTRFSKTDKPSELTFPKNKK